MTYREKPPRRYFGTNKPYEGRKCKCGWQAPIAMVVSTTSAPLPIHGEKACYTVDVTCPVCGEVMRLEQLA